MITLATITDVGLEYAAKILNGVSSSPMKYMGIGSGSTAESTSSTALASEISSATRINCTTGYEAAGFKATWTATFTNTSGSTWSVNEFGVFNAQTGGNMYLRHVFATTKYVDDGGSITITLKVPVARGS